MPDEHVCGIRRFCLGFVHAWCYACLLVKTLCIMYVSANPSTEFDEMFSVAAQRTVAHPCKILLGTIVLILIQVTQSYHSYKPSHTLSEVTFISELLNKAA